MDRGAWQATVHGVTRSQTRLNRLLIKKNKTKLQGLWKSFALKRVEGQVLNSFKKKEIAYLMGEKTTLQSSWNF